MKELINKVKRLARQIRGLFPSELPNGSAAFQAWVDSFASTYVLPTDNRESIEFVLASVIINLGPQTAYKSKVYFFLTMKSGAAKQVAGERFFEIKQQQKAAQLAAAQKAQIEATQLQVASDGQPVQ